MYSLVWIGKGPTTSSLSDHICRGDGRSIETMGKGLLNRCLCHGFARLLKCW